MAKLLIGTNNPSSDVIVELKQHGTSLTQMDIKVTDGELVTEYVVSTDSNEKDDNGFSMFIESVMEKDNSIFVKMEDGLNVVDFFNKADRAEPTDKTKSYVSITNKVITITLKSTVVSPTLADYQNELKLFENTDTVGLHYFMIPSPVNSTDDDTKALFASVNTLSNNRKDFSFRSSVPTSKILGMTKSNSLIAIKELYGLIGNTTFGSVDGNSYKVYDKYNNRTTWITAQGDAIGLRIAQNLNRNVWWASAGANYGLLQGVLDIAHEWDFNEQKTLLEYRINPIVNKNKVGFVRNDQINFTSKKSDLQDENVRELLNYIYRTGKEFLYYKLHEFNDEFTRTEIDAKFNRFLGGIQDGRGIRKGSDGKDGYFVQCDEQNNTDEVISAKMLVIDIAFLPAKAIREIHLRMSIYNNTVDLRLAEA